MNIEIANHLLQLRKEKGYSQEELAEKLGISRQAVSKWERAEASPDIDNLVALAKLYDMSVDQLLLIRKEEARQAEAPESEQKDDEKKSVYVDADGSVHVRKGNKEVHIAPGRIPEYEYSRECACVKTAAKKRQCVWLDFLFLFVVTAAFFVLGYTLGAWHPAWLLFLTIPLYFSLKSAILERAPRLFAFPILAALIYLCLGFFCDWWAWAWLIFLTIPLYYALPKDRAASSPEKAADIEENAES